MKKTFFLISLAFLSIFLSLSAGSLSEIGFKELVVQLLGKGNDMNGIILWQVRLPRTIASILVGSALGTSGALLQSLLRNGLAGPFLLGISAGSGLMVILSIVLGLYVAYIPLLAWIGAIVTVLLVAVISNSSNGLSIQKLILSGVAISSLFGAIQSILLLGSDDSRIQTALQWLIGSLNSIEWSLLILCGAMIGVGLLSSLSILRSLDILNLDDSMAKNMGLNISTKKFIIALIATCLSASAVSLSGLIGFVGLVAPHSARIILSTNVPSKVVPASAVLGAIFLLIADTISRSFASEIPVGAITALFGSPIFIILLVRMNSQKHLLNQ